MRSIAPPFHAIMLGSMLLGVLLDTTPATCQVVDSLRTGGPRARPGAQFRIPAASLIVPGLGQYVYGAVGQGLALTGTAVAGVAIGIGANANLLDELPRSTTDQLAFEGQHVAFTSGALSSWDAFQRAIPDLRREGKYRFLPAERQALGSIVAAPFDVRFLGRWTTWVNLAYTGLITGIVLQARDSDREYEPYRSRDVAFVTALSFNAGVGEEALFRGWLLPLFHQNTGEDFWLSNGMQAGIFGVAHVAQAKAFAVAIAGWAMYEGWLTRHNDWDIRESIFHHFWYDIFVATATFLADEQNPVQLRFPTITF